MSKKDTLLQRRKFIDTINNADSYIKCDISSWDRESRPSLDAELCLADCYKKISWSFSVYAHAPRELKKELKEMRAKARNVQKILDEFFSTLEAEYQKLEDFNWDKNED